LKILITGGAGFIGSNLAEKLIKRHNEIYILDWVSELKNLKNIVDRVHFIKGDIRKVNFRRILKDNEINGVVHLAAVSRVVWGEKDPEKCIDINVNGTKRLLEAISKNDKKPWIIFGSSREVYGEPRKLPVKEDYPKIPINVYGRSKLIGEQLVKRYAKMLNLHAIVLRFSNVYGNEKDILDRVIPRFIIAALKNEKIEIHGGNQIFDFTYINDTVNGIIKAIELLSDIQQNTYFYEDFHLLPGEPSTLQNIVKMISDHLQKDLIIKYTPPRNYDVKKFYGDPSKAEDILGFKSKVKLKKGIPMTIERFKEVFNL